MNRGRITAYGRMAACWAQRFSSDVHSVSRSRPGSTASVPTIPPHNTLRAWGRPTIVLQPKTGPMRPSRAFSRRRCRPNPKIGSPIWSWSSGERATTNGGCTLDQLTRVSTDKVLENATIVDRWYDAKKNLYYALGGMQRAHAETALMERMTDLDHTIHSDVAEAHQTADKLAKVRALRRATRNLVLRETYNADLRVIRASGQGTAASLSRPGSDP